MPETRISATTPVVQGSVVARDASIETPRHPATHVTFRYTCPDPSAAARYPDARPAVLALLPAAMVLGDPVVVDGPLPEGTVAQLTAWQEQIAAWHPGRLRPVAIHAEEADLPRAPEPRGALTAFSGGTDSCHTASTGIADAGLMVHGLDIALADEAVFERAWARSERLLDSFGLAGYRLATDVRATEARYPVDWETVSHGIWLAAALSCLAPWFDELVIPSTFPTSCPKLPWASNPITDPLLGSAATPVVHHGVAFDKLDKVLAIAHLPAVAADVRVCWQGELLDRNCGRCFKCTVTQAGFWLAGVEAPGAFPVRATLDDVRALALDDHYRRFLGSRFADAARTAGRAELAAAFDEAVRRGGAQP